MMMPKEAAVMPLDPALRKRIRDLLYDQDMDQRDLAEQSGLSESTVSSIVGKRGKANDVKLSTLEAMARVLGCTLRVLIEDKQEQSD